MRIRRPKVAADPVLWQARSFARFWEPGAQEWTHKRLHLPDGMHVTAAHYDKARVPTYREADGPIPGNLITNGGLVALFSQLRNGTKDWAASGASSGWTGLGVGDSTTPEAKTQTDLIGTKSFRWCDQTYPLLYPSAHPVAGQPALTQGQILFGTTFAAGEANGSWNEYGAIVPNGSATILSGAAVTSLPTNYVLLNRKSPAGLGDKAAGAPASLYVLCTGV